MGFLKRLFCGCPDDYDICDERGHDFRDGVEMEQEVCLNVTKLRYLRDTHRISDRVQITASPHGDKYSYLKVRHYAVNVCRDCGEENRATDDLDTLVLCEDGEYRPFGDLFSEKDDDEEEQ